MRRKERGLSGFARGILVYILLMVLLGGAALLALNAWLRRYEDCNPMNTARAYRTAFLQGSWSESWENGLASLDTRIQSPEESRAFVQKRMEEAQIRKLPGEETRYGFYDAEGNCFLRLELRETGERKWGLAGWTITAEDCDLRAWTQVFSALVPEDARVTLFGRALDERFVTETDIPFEYLETFGWLIRQPKLRRYEAGPFLGAAEAEIVDAEGRTFREPYDEQSFLDNCSTEEREELRDFVERFLQVYLPYAGDLNQSGRSFWPELREMVVLDSDFEYRLELARRDFGYGNTRDIRLLATDYFLFANLHDGHYVVDLCYRTETTALRDPVEEDNHTRLLIRLEEDTLFVEGMYNY